MDVIGLPARAAEVWGCGRDATVNLRDGAAANGNRTKQREFPTSLRLLQLPNNAKTAISITKAVPTTANTKYISPGEDGATFMTCLAPYRIDCLTAEILKATKFWNPKFPQSSLKFSRAEFPGRDQHQAASLCCGATCGRFPPTRQGCVARNSASALRRHEDRRSR